MNKKSRFSSTKDMDFLSELYDRHKGIIYKTILEQMNDTSDLDDVIQETVIRLMKNLAVLRTLNEKARALYIAKTAYTAAMDYGRRAARERSRRVDLEDAAELMSDQDLESAVLENELQRTQLHNLREALKRLSETDRELLIGKYIRGESDETLAGRLGIKPSTIRVRLMRARGRARRLILEKERLDEHE